MLPLLLSRSIRRSFLVSAAASAALTLAACGSDGSSSSSDSGPVTPGGDAGGVQNPEFTACEDNLDCAGGEICRDDLCRQACVDDDECDGLTPVCDLDEGYCIGCRGDADCAGGERCRIGICESFCRSADDCGDGQACNALTGECIEAECAENRDCQGGEACRSGLCRPIDEPICEPGASRCEGSTLVTCTADGRREVETPCLEPDICQDTGRSASCIDPTCEPFSIGCVDDSTAFVCSAAGDARDLLPCRADQRCEAGSCVRRACTPGSIECDGGAVRVCNDDGSAFELIDCGSLDECADTPYGCTCTAGACAPRVCQPGTAECVGPGSRACLDDGRTIGAVEACGDDEGCFGGACVPALCEPGAVRCSGSSLLTCESSGDGWETVDCRASGAFCDPGSSPPVCRSTVCEPGVATCNRDGDAVLACNARGSEQTTTPCDDGEYCAAGRCLEQACTPGTRSCRSGNVHVCNPLGSGFSLSETCDSGTTCRGGACVEDTGECSRNEDCVRPAARCEGSVLLRFVPNGTCSSGTCRWPAGDTEEDCAATGQLCNESAQACVEPPTDCASDAQCVTLAGSHPDADTARCDPRVGCIIPGLCASSGSPVGVPTIPDPFSSACLSGQTCEVDLLGGVVGGDIGASCAPCTVGNDATCRAGEVCRSSLLGGSATCRAESGGGGDFPFPFPFP